MQSFMPTTIMDAELNALFFVRSLDETTSYSNKIKETVGKLILNAQRYSKLHVL